MSKVTIYHNPRCSKSRQTLALLEDRGIQPEIIRYLDEPPDAATIRRLLGQLGMTARELMRAKEPVCAELGLDDPTRSDDEIIDAMTRQPILIERPIVVSGERAALGRPPEAVLEIL